MLVRGSRHGQHKHTHTHTHKHAHAATRTAPQDAFFGLSFSVRFWLSTKFKVRWTAHIKVSAGKERGRGWGEGVTLWTGSKVCVCVCVCICADVDVCLYAGTSYSIRIEGDGVGFEYMRHPHTNHLSCHHCGRKVVWCEPFLSLGMAVHRLCRP